VFIVLASGGQKPQFWANFDIFGGSSIDPLLPMRAKFGVLQQTRGLRLRAKFRLDRFILSPSGGKNNFAIFSTLAFSGVANWQHSEKVEHGYATTNLPLSNGIKVVSVLPHFMAKSGASLSFNSVTNRQTHKKLKTQRFWLPRRRVKSEPHQTWHGDRGPRARSCTSKLLGV